MSDIAEVLGQDFDPKSVGSPSTDYGLIKPGWYDVIVNAAKVKRTKSGTGSVLRMEMTIMGGEFDDQEFVGRKVWPNINLVNSIQLAEEIGQRDLAALTMACELESLRDTSELIDQTLQVRIKIAKSKKEEYGDENSVTAYRASGGGRTAVAPPTAAVSEAEVTEMIQKPNPDTAKKRPWE